MDEKERLTLKKHPDISLFKNDVKTFISKLCDLDEISENDLILFCLAFTTPSYTNEKEGEKDYNRLEFYGDAVIKQIVSKTLYDNYPEQREGNLSYIAQHLYSNKSYPECLFRNDIDLIPLIRFGNHIWNQSSNKKNSEIFTAVGDCFEALIGALELTNHYDCAVRLVNKTIEDEIIATFGYILNHKANFSF